MRQVVLDTETTGLETRDGHRIIEIGAVELVGRRFNGRKYHQYIQPDREIDAGAMEVHGITHEFLADKPRFADIVDELMSFLEGAELIIHNATFDVGFLNYELQLLDRDYAPLTSYCSVFDTLSYARKLHPGMKNNLDALCKRYNVNNTHRDLHGALLDAEILADVYLAMTGGQSALALDSEKGEATGVQEMAPRRNREDRPALKVISAKPDEVRSHEEYLARIEKSTGAMPVWNRE